MADEENSSDHSSPGTCEESFTLLIYPHPFPSCSLLVITATITKKIKKYPPPADQNTSGTDEDNEKKNILGSAGGIISTSPQVSRARVLSEQKELNLQKRQNSIQKGPTP